MNKKTFIILALLSLNSVASHAQNDTEASEVQAVKQFKATANVFKASLGLGLIYSQLQTPRHTYKRHGCYDLDITYQHTWRKGWGLGLNYAYNVATLNAEFLIAQNYIGPSAVYDYRRGKFSVDVALGCGYVQYSERVKIMDNHYRVRVVKGTEGGLGLYWRLGAEYHIGKHFGIGAQVTSLSAFYSEPADIQIPADEVYGIKRINILIGPRVYF